VFATIWNLESEKSGKAGSVRNYNDQMDATKMGTKRSKANLAIGRIWADLGGFGDFFDYFKKF
jgi:hypothetical protein